jgi:hypothetical protein
MPPENNKNSPSGADPNLIEGPESNPEPRQETEQLSRADPGPTAEEPSGLDHTFNTDGDPDTMSSNVSEMKLAAEPSSVSNPPFESSDSSKKPIPEGEDVQYWEWLHFYLSHRSSRVCEL